jgi:uncharacterized damage-inducible protein DinB
MTENALVRLFEHNNWANAQMIKACCAMSDEQLDAKPQSATKGSIRETLTHLVTAQRGYLSLLTLPVEARPTAPLAFAEMLESARLSGEALRELATDEPGKFGKTRLQTKDGYYVEPWVVLVQVINHATEHREQLSSMLTSLGVTPPDLDGWTYGEVTNALVPISSDRQ